MGTNRLLLDARLALRGLLRVPALTIMVGLCVGLGLGTATAALRILDTLLLRDPPGVRGPEHVVRLYFPPDITRNVPRLTPAWASYPVYLDVQRSSGRVFENVAALWSSDFGVGRGEGARRVHGALVSDTFFPLLGVHPFLGHLFTRTDALIGSPSSVVVSYRYWKSTLGGRPDVLGTVLEVGGERLTIVGVADPDFRGIDPTPTDIWMPLVLADRLGLGANILEYRDAAWVRIVGRLRPSTPVSVAAQDVTAALRQLGDLPSGAGQRASVVLGPLNEGRGPYRVQDVRVGIWVAGVAVMFLLVTCANVAGLSVAREIRRYRRTAICVTLGATRWDVIRVVLIEQALLATAGGLLGLLVSSAFVGVGHHLGLATPPPLDGRAVTLFVGLVTGTAVLASLAPMLQSASTRSVAPDRLGQHGLPRRAVWLQSVLLVGQLAVAVSLIIGAVAFVRAFRRATTVNLGIDADHLLVASAMFTPQYRPAERAALVMRMYDHATDLPFVRSVSLAGPPLFRGRVMVPVGTRSGDAGTLAMSYLVDSQYFRTTGTPVVRGRSFSGGDYAPLARVAIVNEVLARQLWPNGDALGQCLVHPAVPDGGCSIIVGITQTGRYTGINELPTPALFLPLDPERAGASTLYARTVGDPKAVASGLQRELQKLAPDLPYVSVEPVTAALDPELRPWRTGALLFSTLGSLALLLASVGLYGVTSLLAASRTREIAIRLALGSPRRRIVQLVLRHSAFVVSAGLCAGYLVAALGARALGRLVPGIDVITASGVAVVSGALGVVALVALCLPAWHAAAVDPVVAMREQ